MSPITRLGDSTYEVDKVYVNATAAVVGPKEGAGPFHGQFDRVWEDEMNGQSNFEQAERALLENAYQIILEKSHLAWSDIDLVVGGDLLDQLISTDFAGRTHQRPLLGLFAACAVFTEGIGLAALLVAGSGPRRTLVSAVSHHFAAERQFRYPVELGYQRTPTAAWTSTAAGAALITDRPAPIKVHRITFGRVMDYGGKDPNDMASAMTPAALDTIRRHLTATGQQPDDFDAIFTGDLGDFGLTLLREYGQQQGVTFGPELNDCGRSLYDLEAQDVHNGGSGPGCSASVFAGPLAGRLRRGEWQNLLLVSTGALFSPTTYQQGESIPCIAHAVEFRREEVPSE
ncbi:MAG: stage V sporulation protein AD [Sulfobacillus sp.]|nr:stage V sporulation protein AD [Sulfobacillus sp.]